jgi:hypothetical protein
MAKTTRKTIQKMWMAVENLILDLCVSMRKTSTTATRKARTTPPMRVITYFNTRRMMLPVY